MHFMRSASATAAVVLLALFVACAEQGSSPSDPTTPTGPVRSVSAVSGQLVINEFLADPSVSTDASGEWFEIYNRGASAVNIQNFRIASGNDAVHTISASVSVPAGGYVVLGRDANTASNGGVTLAYAYGTAITLANAGDWLALRDAAGATVDSINYTSTTAGKAWGVKDASLDNTTVGTATNWTLQTSLFGAGDVEHPDG